MNKTVKLLSPLALMFTLVACNSSLNPGSSMVATAAKKTGIINGETVSDRKSSAARSLVYVDFLDRSNRSVGFCTGTLIGKGVVLTAGHCFDPKVTQGLDGFRIIFDSNSNYHVRQGRVSITHQNYNSSGGYDHDIALAFFNGEIPEGYSPVAYDQDANANYAGRDVYVYGYGRTRDLNEEGRSFFTTSSGFLHRGVLKVDQDFGRFKDRYMTDPKVATYTCYGDSGGPQFFHESGVLKVVGINSAVYGKRDKNGNTYCRGSRAQATRVAYFSSWIASQIQRYR